MEMDLKLGFKVCAVDDTQTSFPTILEKRCRSGPLVQDLKHLVSKVSPLTYSHAVSSAGSALDMFKASHVLDENG